MNSGILVAGEADEAHLAVTLRAGERVDRAVAREMALRIVVVHALVDLPQIEDVGLQTAERLFELTHRLAPPAAVRAQLRHQEHVVAPIGDGLAHQRLRSTIVIFPGVVHERDAGIDGGVHETDGFALALERAEVVPAETERRHVRSRVAERAQRNVRHETMILRFGFVTRLTIERNAAIGVRWRDARVTGSPVDGCASVRRRRRADARQRPGNSSTESGAERGALGDQPVLPARGDGAQLGVSPHRHLHQEASRSTR